MSGPDASFPQLADDQLVSRTRRYVLSRPILPLLTMETHAYTPTVGSQSSSTLTPDLSKHGCVVVEISLPLEVGEMSALS